jgi:acetoin utilization deacetylase AcuC-like enzyme
VFCFSVHGANNLPFRKERSTLDIPLPDGAGDDAFLDAVSTGVARAFAAGPYDIAFYIAGADAHEGDRLGRLKVSARALAERDQIVLGACARASVPVVTVMGGGYGHDVDRTVAIHFNSVLTAGNLALPLPTNTIL